jgi:hypothetical protein
MSVCNDLTASLSTACFKALIPFYLNWNKVEQDYNFSQNYNRLSVVILNFTVSRIFFIVNLPESIATCPSNHLTHTHTQSTKCKPRMCFKRKSPLQPPEVAM